MTPPFAWTDDEVRTALDVSPQEDCSLVFTGISTDSRTTLEGNLFVALCGDNFDGHEYVSEAIERGAAAVVCEQFMPTSGVPLCVVPDSREAMGRICHIDCLGAGRIVQIIA